jgi:hypothetical protein
MLVVENAFAGPTNSTIEEMQVASATENLLMLGTSHGSML